VEVIFILLVAGCGLTVALTIGAVVLLKLGVITHYAFKPERPEDKLGDYGLEESHEARDGTGDS
jgi:hypothetical protein